MGRLKVTGGRIGGYTVDIELTAYGPPVQMAITGSSHYNHDRVVINLTPGEAEVLAADLAEHARLGRERPPVRHPEVVDGEVEL